MLADPKSAKNTVKPSFFFELLGSAVVKAPSKMLVKWSPSIGNESKLNMLDSWKFSFKPDSSPEYCGLRKFRKTKCVKFWKSMEKYKYKCEKETVRLGYTYTSMKTGEGSVNFEYKEFPFQLFENPCVCWEMKFNFIFAIKNLVIF
jgi:hypothetical protein